MASVRRDYGPEGCCGKDVLVGLYALACLVWLALMMAGVGG